MKKKGQTKGNFNFILFYFIFTLNKLSVHVTLQRNHKLSLGKNIYTFYFFLFEKNMVSHSYFIV
jgi:hypothetical protein